MLRTSEEGYLLVPEIQAIRANLDELLRLAQSGAADALPARKRYGQPVVG